MDFEEIAQRCRSRLFRFALASLRDKDAAETIVQDCLMRAFGARDSFRGDCTVDIWLMRIAVNLVRDHIKNRRLQFWKRTRSASNYPLESLIAWDSRGQSPEKAAILKQQMEAVWEAADRLPARQKTVFLLRFVEDLDILEIAAATGMKEGTVKVHLSRALAAVRERLRMHP